MELVVACEGGCGVAGASCDGTDGESVVVGLGVGGVELALRRDVAWSVPLDAVRTVVVGNGYRSGTS